MTAQKKRRLMVVNVVGLTPKLITQKTPFLNSLVSQHGRRFIGQITPSVTCSVQMTYLTGEMPQRHGAVGNGWYFRDLAQVWFWRQPFHLIQAQPVWEALREKDPKATTAQMFWWYNMYHTADFSATPRPMYPADGRKIPDCYTHPLSLRDELTERLGRFPLFEFWGPKTSIRSSQWIAESAKYVEQNHRPTLQLVYLPHMDYNLQRLGPEHPTVQDDVTQIDQVVQDLWQSVQSEDLDLIVLSEYGITPVLRPVHLNRWLRKQGWLQIKEELGLEYLDAGASKVFAVADHQVAHVYVQDASLMSRVRGLLDQVPGVEQVWDKGQQKRHGLAHPRSGEFVVIADSESWFTYYYWEDDQKAPDFARTVDIHRKPGFDPVELFIDPQLPFPKFQILSKLARKKLGFRQLLDVIPLDASLVKGSHGRPTEDPRQGPLLISTQPNLLPETDTIAPTEIKNLMLSHTMG